MTDPSAGGVREVNLEDEVPTSRGAARANTSDYDPTEDREKARKAIAYWLMVILTATVAGVAVVAFKDGTEDLTTLVAVFLTPIIGLVGTMLGFYFGGENRPQK